MQKPTDDAMHLRQTERGDRPAQQSSQGQAEPLIKLQGPDAPFRPVRQAQAQPDARLGDKARRFGSRRRVVGRRVQEGTKHGFDAGDRRGREQPLTFAGFFGAPRHDDAPQFVAVDDIARGPSGSSGIS